MNNVKRYDETARVMWVVFLVIWFSYAFVHNLTGCNQAVRQDISNFFSGVASCEAASVAGNLIPIEQQVMDEIDNSIANGVSATSSSWKSFGENLGVSLGVNLLNCAISQLFILLTQPQSSDMSPSMLSPNFKIGNKSYSRKPEYTKYLQTIFRK